MAKINAPFKGDIVGSFLRPQALKIAREQFLRDGISELTLRAIEDAEIRELVRKGSWY